MALPNVNQIVDPTTVREVAAERVEAQTVVREFFQDVEVPDGAGEEYEIPVPAEELGLPEEVEPGADTTYDREEYGRPVVSRQIFKKGSKIPEEDVNDNVFDLVQDHTEGHAKNMAKKLDRAAFAVLDAAAPSANAVSKDGGSDGTLDFEDINAGVTELSQRGEDGFTADMALIGPGAKEDITNYLADRGTDLGDEAVRNGELGEFAGLRFMFTNNVSLSGANAIVVDSDHFGFEGEWQPVDTDQATDFDADAIKMKIKAAYGWTAKRDIAAVRVEG
jgi:hypothetical protein